jgi:hypothetical protein
MYTISPFSPQALAYYKLASSLCLAVGLGWVFAEVRRFFLERGYFVEEAVEDARDGHLFSLCYGLILTLAGAFGVFNFFGYGLVIPSFLVPYVATGSDGARFLHVFGGGLAAWVVFSALSVRFLPPPLFGPNVTGVFCGLIRSVLFLLWGAMFYFARHHIGAYWKEDFVRYFCGVFFAGMVLFMIITGSVGNQRNWSGVPPITCEDRPFPYVSLMLVWMAFIFAILIGNKPA